MTLLDQWWTTTTTDGVALLLEKDDLEHGTVV
jgi:hypothetical protein